MRRNEKLKKMTVIAILTALVVLLQLLFTIKLGPFAIATVLIPIVVGAVLYGELAGMWLGFAFGLTVILSGDAAPFLALNVPLALLTVFGKGILCGLFAALVYRLVSKKSSIAGTILAAAVCPIVNTGVFLICGSLFFYDILKEWAGGSDVGMYILTGIVLYNFVGEFAVNLILSPAIVRIIKIGKKKRI